MRKIVKDKRQKVQQKKGEKMGVFPRFLPFFAAFFNSLAMGLL